MLSSRLAVCGRRLCGVATSANGQILRCSASANNLHISKARLGNNKSYRWYTSTTYLCKDDKNSDDAKNGSKDEIAADLSSDEYDTLLSSDDAHMTQAEIEEFIAQEEKKYQDELDAKNKVPSYWRPGMRKKPQLVTRDLVDLMRQMIEQQGIDPTTLKADNEEDEQLLKQLLTTPWTLRDTRCGALAIKVGMMPVFDTWGERHPCTVLYMDNNIVLGHKTMEKHGYMAVQVAAGARKRKNVGKSVLGQYKNILSGLDNIPDDDDDDDNDDDNSEEELVEGVDKLEYPPYTIREFRVSDEAHLVPLYSRIHARHFVPGQNIDVSGISKGKGFQGPMKRHGFAGMPASHGVSKSHRAHGSTGQCQDPGKVFKGKKMAGRMGSNRVTKQNLRIVKIDCGRNLIYVKGAIPGSKGTFVEIRDAVKKPLWTTNKVLDQADRPPLPTFEFDPSIDGCGTSGHTVFMPLPEIDPLDPELNNNDATSI